MLAEGSKNAHASVLRGLARDINSGMMDRALLRNIVTMVASSHNHNLYSLTLREALKLKKGKTSVLTRLTNLISEQHGEGCSGPNWNQWYDAFGQNPRHQDLITF